MNAGPFAPRFPERRINWRDGADPDYGDAPEGFYDASEEPVHPALDPHNLADAILRAQAGAERKSI